MDAGVVGIDALPGEILVEVFRGLRAHSLARCRCVCALWRALVDGHGLLRPHALPPRAFPGFFTNARVKPWRPGPGFLPPPHPHPRAPGGADTDRLAFLRPHLPCGGAEAAVQHHCNGLLLCFQDYYVGRPSAGFVCNPTTERWARLPPPPTWWPRERDGLFLAFDPAVSLEYEVLLLPVPPPRQGDADAGLPAVAPPRRGHVTLGMFVPESFGRKQQLPDEGKTLLLSVFSSAHGRWTKRLLAPGRCAPARLYDRVMRPLRWWVRTWRSALYCRGSLYAHCEKRVLVVLRFSEGTYDMVKLPPDHADAVEAQHAVEVEHALSGLPRDSIFPSTEDGVLLRYASVDDGFRVKVWALRESPDGGGQLEWTLTHDKDLAAHARLLDMLTRRAPSSNCAPLAAEEGKGGGQRKSVWFADEDGGEEAGGGDVGGGCSARWNWDDAGLTDVEPGEDDQLLNVGAGAPSPFTILGCHPSKEVIFLAAGALHVVVAYHVSSGKVQHLGRIASLGDGDRVQAAFAYRPCIVDALPSYDSPFPSLKDANKSR